MREAEEKPESSEKKKHRYCSPYFETFGTDASASQQSAEGKGKLKRDKGGSQDTGIGENESEHAPKCPKLAPENHTQTQEQVPLKALLSLRKVGENVDEKKAQPEAKPGSQPSPRQDTQPTPDSNAPPPKQILDKNCFG